MGSENEQVFPRVPDALTLFLWRAPAVGLARSAEAAHLPAAVFAIGEALLSLLVFAFLWDGRYWLGVLVAVPAMILSAAGAMTDARAARLQHALAILFPLLWWWAWAHGLAAYGRPLEPLYATMVLWTVLGGTLAGAAIDVLALRRFGIIIDSWRPLDSRFRLVSASRNPNLVILALALAFGRPDSGLVLLAWWTLVSVIFHAVRLAQMTERQVRGHKITSWLQP